MEDVAGDVNGLQDEVPAPAPVPEKPPGYGGPMPMVGEMVHYHPRPSEIRRGRMIHAALVTWRNEEERTLDLAIIYEAQDVRQQDGVREWPGGTERGWERMSSLPALPEDIVLQSAKGLVAAVKGEIAALREMLLGKGDDQYDVPEASFLGMLDSQDERLDKIEGMLSPAAAAALGQTAAAAARGRGQLQVTGAADAKKAEPGNRKARKAAKAKRKGK